MSDATSTVGPIGRLGRWSATHGKWVAVIWVVIALGLGFLAPRVETSLSGAGWEDTGSQSVAARQLIQDNFGGNSSSALMVVVHSPEAVAGSPEFGAAVSRVTRTLEADPAVSQVVPPMPGQTISRDGHTAVVMGGAAANATEMVRAADRLKAELAADGGAGVSVYLTGASGMWSDFNEANRSAMMKSELLSWPVTLAILVLAFGALVAAGLPLLLTILGLVATAGALYLTTLVFDVSIWAMNFALMFALALGIDYALFIVQRFRAALFGSGRDPVDATAETMDTAGKAVLFSGLTVLISLSAVMIVPSPAFRSMALGIMISVVFILLATLTLLPAVLAKLGPRVDKGALKWAHSGEHRSKRFERWGQKLWSRPALFGIPALLALLILAVPVFGLKTGMPSITVVPQDDGSRQGYTLVSEAFGPGAPGTLQIVG
ncbi:MAG: MMPL family transporter, partial [Miltoncostaeaceae bacterium]